MSSSAIQTLGDLLQRCAVPTSSCTESVRKMNRFLLLILCFLVVGCATVKMKEPRVFLTPQQLADTIGARNYDGLCTWIHKNLPYKEDRVKADEWKEPDVTLRDGYGDCEDLAGVALEVMILWGVKDSYFMGVSKVSRNLGHVVAFFRDKPEDEWRIFSNDDPQLYAGGRTLDSVMHRVGSLMRYGSDLEYQLAKDNSGKSNIPKSEEASYGLV